MSGEQFQTWNHFVPQFVLKRFASSPGKVWEYRILVSHDTVKTWNEIAISRAAAHEHLYTVAEAEQDSDGIEKWFNANFEAPASLAIERIENRLSMTRQHWHSLAKFFALQDRRTPSAYIGNQIFYQEKGAAVMKATFNDLKEKLKDKSYKSERQVVTPEEHHKLFPFRVITEPSGLPGEVLVRAEVAVGRRSWMWGIRHSLSDGFAIQSLIQHNWTVLLAPQGHAWITSDNPAVKLGLNADGTQHLGGGWGVNGHVLLLPLSPRHLLFTQIGAQSPEKYTEVSLPMFNTICSAIANNAFRSIFASTQNEFILRARPKIVNAEQFENERQQWREWHEDQSDAENFRTDVTRE